MNSSLRALLITALLTAVMLVWFKPETPLGIAILCAVIAVFFGLVASFSSETGEHACQLISVVDVDKLQIRFNQKRFTVFLWGIAAQPEHPHHANAQQALDNWLRGKHLRIKSTQHHNDREYWQLLANDEDLGLWLLTHGHADLTKQYLTSTAYENATTTARFQKRGIHQTVEHKPWESAPSSDAITEEVAV